MADLDEIKAVLAKAKRQAHIAESDLGYSELRLEEQRKQLDNLMKYRDECARGMYTKDNGLTIAQMRDYELLLQHLEGVVSTQHQRVVSSQNEFEGCKVHLSDVRQHCEKIETLMQQHIAEQAALKEAEQKTAEAAQADEDTGVQPDAVVKQPMPVWKKGTGKPARKEDEDAVPGKPLTPSYR